MAAAVSFSSVKAQLVVPATKAEEAVNFYKAAFGAEEVTRSTYRKRKGDQETVADVICAEMKIGGFGFLVCDQNDDSALPVGLSFVLETNDVDAAMSKAVSAGAVVASEITESEDDGCCGGLVGKVKDPFGVVWSIASFSNKKCNDAAGPEAP